MLLSRFPYLVTLASVALLSNGAIVDRAASQPGDDEFHSQASELVSKYIAPSIWAVITPSVVAAVSAAKITDSADPAGLVVGALASETQPPWLSSAIPTQFSQQFAALESAIDNLRSHYQTVKVVAVPTVIAVTTTAADGSVITASISTTISKTETTGPEATTTPGGGGDGDGDGDDSLAAISAPFAMTAIAAAAAFVGLAIAL